jgi:hypothetical protein
MDLKRETDISNRLHSYGMQIARVYFIFYRERFPNGNKKSLVKRVFCILFLEPLW